MNIIVLNSCVNRNCKSDKDDSYEKTVIKYNNVPFIKSTEGNHVVIYYNQGQISNSNITIYGCGGKSEINYFFGLDTIVVNIVEVKYNSSLTEIKDPMNYDTVTQNYKINYDGIIYDKDTLIVDNLFADFKLYVPFVICN
jgi:hypothetical protein